VLLPLPRIGSGISSWLFTPFIVKSIKYRYGFIFASCNLLGAVVVYFFLYESSDLTLESVNLMYTDPTCKPWTSRQWAPPGFTSRRDLIEQIRASEQSKPLASGAMEEDRVEKTMASSGDGHVETENSHDLAAVNGQADNV